MNGWFLLRWSARDLRRKWLQVTAIAFVIAIGTGVYAGLGSTSKWRSSSNDASFARTGMYDLRVRAAEGATTATGSMLAALDRLPDPTVVTAAEERLIVATQVDASHDGESVRVPGAVVGLDVAHGGPRLTVPYVRAQEGRALGQADDGSDVAVLERNFASYYHLAPTAHLRLSGEQAVDVVGLGMAPEYFLVTTTDGGFFAEANYAAVFVPLTTAQRLTGRGGLVNDLVLTLRPGADRAAVAGQLSRAFADAGLGLGETVMTARDDDTYRMLYDDIKGDEKFWNVFAALILAGATFGAFNLSSRMVEAQRREIGIGMALGASPGRLALRPLLVGVEIALAGVVLGVGVGVAATFALRPVYTSMLPLPVWHTELQATTFVRGALLGFVLPLLATAWPVARAVRMAPVDAIATANRTARSGLAPLLRRLRWPAGAFRRMPVGNVLRSPRRTLLTSLGIAAAIATLVTLLGLLDSFRDALDRSDRHLLAGHRDRVAVGLDGFVAADGPELTAVAQARSVQAVEPVLRTGGRMARAGEPVEGPGAFDVVIEALDFGSDLWRPTLASGSLEDRSGIVLSKTAADELGVRPGSTVTLQHPLRQGDRLSLVTTEVRVSGVHLGPFRFNAYVDRAALGAFGTAGLANQAYVLPAPGATPDDVERELFEVRGVTSVQPVDAASQIVRDSLGEFTSIFQVLEGFILLLALLMAYNATSINADERARERATLFAFGFPLWRVLVLEVAEGVGYGLFGTAMGVLLGRFIVDWMARSLLASTLPELRLQVALSPATVLTALALGVLAVAVAPLFTARRIRRMDVPGTLRVVE